MGEHAIITLALNERETHRSLKTIQRETESTRNSQISKSETPYGADPAARPKGRGGGRFGTKLRMAAEAAQGLWRGQAKRKAREAAGERAGEGDPNESEGDSSEAG